jgi:putative hemolysin
VGKPVTVRDLTRSTLQSTVSLSRKTGSALQSTLKMTMQLLGQRKRPSRNKQARNTQGRGFDMTLLFPQAANSKRLSGASVATPPTTVAGTVFTRAPEDGFEPVVAGKQIIRLATSADELDAAQALRYRVFYNEMGARPLPEMEPISRDFDTFDTACDHLIVVDQERPYETRVVGTYRLMRRENARTVGGFYSASEFDISKLANFPGAIMELGRSCVDAAYRDRATMNLLWRGLAEYMNRHGVDLMFGCASLPGTDPAQLKVQLSYLYHYHLAPEAIRARALPERFTNMNLLPKEAIDPKRALASLPPLLKGYLRVGGFVGDGAVIDHQFNTTDVCIIVKTDLIAGRYTRHYDLGGHSPEHRGAPPFKQVL